MSKTIKAYLLNQRALVVSKIAKQSKSGEMNFYDLHLLTGEYIHFDKQLRDLNSKQDGKETSKTN